MTPKTGADDEPLTREAIARARSLPANVPDEDRRAEVRARLLATAAAQTTGPASHARWIAGVTAVAAGALLVAWFAHAGARPAAAVSHVTLGASPGARYLVASPPPRELIRLWEGALELDVRPLGPGEQVRVETGDGEVEVRGTRFQVTARADRLVGVDVTHGRVEVRPRGAPQIVLGAGERWRPAEARPTLASPTVAPATTELPRETAGRPRRVEARTAAAVERALRPTREEALYDDAWDALRARRFNDAAAGFERVLAESPRGSLADEAGYWRATALARGGEPAKAIDAFRVFLSTYRASSRRGEASAILGWLLVDAHRPDEARPLFRDALGDARDTVRASARQGLEVLSRAAAPR